MGAQHRQGLVIVTALCALCYFWRLGTPGLFDFNEGLYVEAAREMVLRNDYVTGRVNGVPFYDKPPLALWQTALLFRVFGFSEWCARLPVAIAATLTTLLTFWLGSKLGRRVGLLAAAAFSLNPIVLGTARQMTMDIHQTWWVAAALVSAWLAMQSVGRRATAWWIAFWGCCGLGFLSKSFPGLLPVPVVLVYVLLRSKRKLGNAIRGALEMRPVLGLVVLVAIIAPWHVLAYRKDGSFFVYEYWTLHHLGILHGTEFGHARPVWYYLPVLLGAFFPWSLMLPLALSRSNQSESADLHGFVVCWAATGFILFSLMKSKLVSYLLPIFPALALLMAIGIDRSLQLWEATRRRSPLLLAGITTAAVIQFAVTGFGWYYLYTHVNRLRDPEALQLTTPAMITYGYVVLALLAVGLAVSAGMAWIRPPTGVAGVITTMVLFTVLTWETGLPAYDRAVNLPLRRIAAAASALGQDGTPLIVHIGRPRRPSVFFYLPPHLFTGPLPADPRRGFLLESWDQEPVRDAIAASARAYVIADSDRGRETLDGLGMVEVVQRAGRWSLFAVTRTAP